MKKMLAMACGWALVVSMVQAVETAGVLSDDGKTLTVDVAENEVAEFDSATLLANVSVITNVVKTGLGRLDLGDEDDLSSYMGTITIKAGTWRAVAPASFGHTATTNAGPVVVEPTGAIELKTATKSKFILTYKTFRLSGTGPYGKGAVIFNCTLDQGGKTMGDCVLLDGDTLIAMTNNAHFYWNTDKFMKVKLNGHTMRVRTDYTAKNFIVGYPQFDDAQGGEIFLDKITMQFMNGSGKVFLKPFDDGRIVVTNGAGLQFSAIYGQLLWGVDVYTNGFLQCAGNWVHTNNDGTVNFANVTNRNLWRGPVRMHQDWTDFRIVKGDKDGSTMGFDGPISGGGIYAFKGAKTGNNSKFTPYLHLYCPTNSFTGGLVADEINLYLWHDGALPAEGGPLMATNSNVMLMDTVHSLPGATFSCTGSVNNARGVWNGPVAKTEMGKLIYNSLVGGGTLDVQQGTFKIVPKEPRAKLAGLIEGDIFSGSADAVRVAVASDSTTARAITNRLALGAAALYDAKYRDFWVYDKTIDGHRYRGFTYSGWLWNDTDADETWTFAGAAGTLFSVWIGDTRIIRTGWDGKTIAKEKVTLKPGANRFVATVYNSDSGATPRYGNGITNGVWNVPNFGLGYRKGDWVDDVNVADFSPLMDPGDGSLLTYRRPEDVECPLPTTDWVEPYGNAGATFTNICVRYGAALDLGGADYVVDTLSGVPTIQNCPTFMVKGTLALETFNVAQGRKLVTSGVLAFAPGAQITLDEPMADVATGDYPLVEATGGVTGAPTLPRLAEYRLWRVETTAAGVTLQRLPKGTAFLLR